MKIYSVHGQILMAVQIFIEAEEAETEEDIINKAYEAWGEGLRDIKGREGKAFEVTGEGEIMLIDHDTTFCEVEEEDDESEEEEEERIRLCEEDADECASIGDAERQTEEMAEFEAEEEKEDAS